MRYIILLPFVLAACGSPSLSSFMSPQPDVVQAGDSVSPTLDPTPPPPPPTNARTADEFDTASAEDRADALNVALSAEGRELGRAVVSLGSPTEPGIWLKTPLVSALSTGLVKHVGTGKSVNVELRPTDSGTQISLSAMRLLDVPLTDLPEVIIYAR